MNPHRKHGRARGAPARSEHEQFQQALRGHDDRRRSAGPDRKTLQLCRQVQRAVMLSITDDDVTVDAVEPVGDSPGQLLVRVAVGPSASPVEVVARLNGRAPKLRAQIATAISRKRVPTLTFVAVPRDATAFGRSAADRSTAEPAAEPLGSDGREVSRD